MPENTTDPDYLAQIAADAFAAAHRDDVPAASWPSVVQPDRGERR